MKQSQTILNLLGTGDLRLSKSYRKLAEYIVHNPKEAIHLTIGELAERVDVSVPTVNRFCTKLGFEGFRDFKIRLAQEISSSGKIYSDNVVISDDTRDVMNKVMSSIQLSVKSIIENTNPSDIEQAVNILYDSRNIDIFGVGASGVVALDAQHKFLRLGIPVIAHTDHIYQRMFCATLNDNDVMIVISRTGKNEIIVDCARSVSSRNVPVIGITPKGSPLSQYCSVVINAVTQEDSGLLTPMTSRIVHFALIDLLTTVLFLRKGKNSK